MKKPKKPKKPKKSDPAPPRRLIKEVHVFMDEEGEVVFIEDLDIYVQNLSNTHRDEFTRYYGEDWDPEEAGWDFFWETYERVDLPCSPEWIVELASHLPPGAEDVTFYQNRDEDGYNAGIIFAFMYERPEAEYLELKNAWANRFKQYTKDLRQYEADMAKYEKWRHAQKVKKLEAQLKDLKDSNPADGSS